METDSNIISIILICICVVLSGYFSATETAFSSLNRIRMKNMAEKGDKRAALVVSLSEKYDKLLSTILIGNNVVNIGCASLATLLFVSYFGEERGASLSTVVVTVVVLIFGEISPKILAKESPESFALFSAPIISGLMRLLAPFTFLCSQWKLLLSRMFKSQSSQGITEEELLTIVDEAQESGELDQQESDLIKNAIEFTELTADDILTPRVDVVSIGLDADDGEIVRLFNESGFSRLPVHGETIDDIRGILYQKDFSHKDPGASVGEVMRPALFIAKTARIGRLLKELQENKQHIAVVVDEFGGLSGIVTLEDILEELVGEIWDEHDKVVDDIRQISDTAFIADGSAEVSKLFALLGVAGDEDAEYNTVNGWIVSVLGRIAMKNDQIRYGDLKATVLTCTSKRAVKVKVEKLPEE